jgi:hypothetical protein
MDFDPHLSILSGRIPPDDGGTNPVENYWYQSIFHLCCVEIFLFS